jgi:chemotaxis family two-component system response regulator Rcp1
VGRRGDGRAPAQRTRPVYGRARSSPGITTRRFAQFPGIIGLYGQVMSEAPPGVAQPIQVLVVDDDPGDRLLICEALEAAAQPYRVSTAASGPEALAHLRAVAGTDLVLLDVSMPGMNGHEVLAAIKADDGLRHIPVVIFTTSTAPADVLNIYRLHGSAYLTKPSDLGEFDAVLRQMGHFYSDIATLPRP